ncbi:DUF6172 family protein [Xylophilus ampelinus]|uniref:Uncharacterized protein n=1 Tax=Xylophilus ampelinus TaxID=54067 RepID=A0A318SRB7_9BURK|nr:DUF6172 family protein [Xylophilus ampelinus]MCS4511418.1 DUF6172 family protein [Xylophilus ampelinus]PYE75839.1 hypothetical protein DFQ15_11927 [Xylophilus ampelinus]
MRKTFALETPGKHPDRVLEATKHEIRKYVQRERRKPLPAGADFWDFDCRVGATADDAEGVHLAALTERIDALVQQGRKDVYVEVLARPANRTPRAPAGGDVLAAELDGGDPTSRA